MFNIGDRVLYGIHGICTVTAIESMCFGKTRRKYYCLQPLEQTDSCYYVPTENEAAVAKLSPLMSKEALLELLHCEKVRQNNWISDENQRKLRYRELITSADRGALLNMVYCLYQHKEILRKTNKKFHQCDDAFLHDAQKLLNSEFCMVFDLKPDEVGQFIQKQLNVGL